MNKELKQNAEKTKFMEKENKEINFEKICEMLENKYELKIKEKEERPKNNVFESFFNAILKEEK